MLELDNFKKSKLTSEMATYKARTEQVISTSRKKHKDVEFLIVQRNLYMVSKNLPARLENGIVINYLKYQQLMKKLKGMAVSLKMSEDGLVLSYYNGSMRGNMTLVDMRKHFEGFAHVPDAILKEEVR